MSLEIIQGLRYFHLKSRHVKSALWCKRKKEAEIWKEIESEFKILFHWLGSGTDGVSRSFLVGEHLSILGQISNKLLDGWKNENNDQSEIYKFEKSDRAILFYYQTRYIPTLNQPKPPLFIRFFFSFAFKNLRNNFFWDSPLLNPNRIKKMNFYWK